MRSITHIITGLDVGGAEKALYTLLTNGLEGPFENRVISLTQAGHYGPLLAQAGIPVTCLNMRPGRPTFGALLRLRAQLRAHPTDIVQGWMIHGNFAASFGRKVSKSSPVLAWNIRRTLEGVSTMRRGTRMLTQWGARLSSGADAVIYNAQKSLNQHVELGYCGTNGHHLPNGFDMSVWHPDPAERASLRVQLGIEADARVIGFVGRGHPDKDPQNLFDAFTTLTHTDDTTVLVAVGRDLEGFAPQSTALSGRIKFLGQRSDIARVMQAFDLLCLSSRVEGFPNVLGEAMATAVPCVTTDVGDARDIVGPTGWIALPRDSAALLACLAQAVACSDVALENRGQAARARIKAQFSIQSVVDRYITLYNTLAKERG